MKRFVNQLVPFLFLGVILVIFVLGLILFSYILILGAVVGLILFVLQWLREKFFKTKSPTLYRDHRPKGRTFDHQDDK